MGLDVYLYTREQREANDLHNRASSAYYGRPDYDSLTEEQREALRSEIPPYASQTDIPSERYPEHLFNRRYLRSSYNGGGFNRAVPDFLGDKDATLDGIFEPVWQADHEPLVTVDEVVEPEVVYETGSELAAREPEIEVGEDDEPEDRAGEPGGVIDRRHLAALAETKRRALDIAERLHASDRLRVLTVSPNQFAGTEFLAVGDEAALRIYREHIAGMAPREPEGWYSTRGLDYVFGDGGATFVAAISGAERMFFRDDPWPAVHLIYRAGDEGFESYIQSAEITAEFIDEAVALIERDGSAYISWSG
jgi:hypothetical protein